MATGIDPMAERKAEADAKQREAEARRREAENSFENVARKWWEWWSIGKSPRHADPVRRRLEGDVLLLHGIDIGLVDWFAKPRSEGDALVIHASDHRNGCTSCLGWAIAMICSYVSNCIAVRNHISLEAPLAAQLSPEAGIRSRMLVRH